MKINKAKVKVCINLALKGQETPIELYEDSSRSLQSYF